MASIAAFIALSLLASAFAAYGNVIRCINSTNCPTGQVCNNGICQGPGCFPGDAMVQMYSGQVKQMKDLNIGDKIAAGKDSFSEIYAFGHKDSDVLAEFLKVKTERNTLELTPGHFVPVNVEGKMVYKRATNLKAGDTLYTDSGVSLVVEISKVEKLGLYNPLTLSGKIVVNGVEASVHSDWFLDSVFDAVGANQYLPYAYQSLLAPVRALYNIAGAKLYSAGYKLLDSAVNIADFGTKYGGTIAVGVGLGALAVAAKSI